MTTKIPTGKDFNKVWRGLPRPERRRIAGDTNRGQPQSRREDAAIAISYARTQRRFIYVLFAALAAWFVGVPFVRLVVDGGPNVAASALGALIGGVVVGIPLLWWLTTRLTRAEQANRAVLRDTTEE